MYQALLPSRASRIAASWQCGSGLAAEVSGCPETDKFTNKFLDLNPASSGVPGMFFIFFKLFIYYLGTLFKK